MRFARGALRQKLTGGTTIINAPLKSGRCHRRAFLRQGAAGVGLLAGVGGAILISRRLGGRRESGGAESNPFAYDPRPLTATNPSWLHYEEVGRLPAKAEDSRRIVVGPGDQLFLAAGKYVHVLDASGARGLDIALSSPPRCLAVSGDATLYIGLRDHIEVFDRQGQRRAAWDSPGPKTWFTGLTMSENEVFAADAGHRLVWRYDKSGKQIGRIGEKDAERDIPGFVVPSPFFDLEFHRDGLLRVANPGRHRLEVYTPEGDLEFAWGKASAALDGFCGCCNPVNFALLPDGRYVTCEKGLPRVKVYAAEGSLQSVVVGPESFPENLQAAQGDGLSDSTQGGLDVAVDSQERIYVLDLVKGDIRILKRKKASPETSAAKS